MTPDERGLLLEGVKSSADLFDVEQQFTALTPLLLRAKVIGNLPILGKAIKRRTGNAEGSHYGFCSHEVFLHVSIIPQSNCLDTQTSKVVQLGS